MCPEGGSRAKRNPSDSMTMMDGKADPERWNSTDGVNMCFFSLPCPIYVCWIGNSVGNWEGGNKKPFRTTKDGGSSCPLVHLSFFFFFYFYKSGMKFLGARFVVVFFWSDLFSSGSAVCA